MSARPTLADIARECGVSLSTVSRGLRDHPSISEERRRSIKLVAEAMGFESRISARTMREGVSKLVACVVPSLSHPFMSHFIEKLEAEGSALGYHLLVANSGGSPTTEKAIVKGLIGREVDGVFFIPSSFESTALQLCGNTLNTVVVTQQSPDWPSIGTAHGEGGRLVAEHFLETGRTSCLLVGSPTDQKFEGFLSYFQTARITGFQFDWLTVEGWDDHLSQGVQEALVSRYDAQSIRRFDCVFGFNDVAAIGALHGLLDLGVSVPSEISVCGFDDTPLAKESRPALTSIAQPIGQMVRSAFTLMQRVMAGETIPAAERSFSLKPHLVVRQSTWAPD